MGAEPSQIEADIEATRARMGSDVDALADKVDPRRVVSRRVDATKDRLGSVKDKVMGSTTSTAGSVRDGVTGTASHLGDTASGLTDKASDSASTVKSKAQGNPLAAGLIAFGAGWLLSSLLPASDRETHAAGQLEDLAKDKGKPLADQLSQAASEVTDQLREPAQQAMESIKSTATDAAATIKDEGSNAASGVAQDAQSAGQHVKEHSGS